MVSFSTKTTSMSSLRNNTSRMKGRMQRGREASPVAMSRSSGSLTPWRVEIVSRKSSNLSGSVGPNKKHQIGLWGLDVIWRFEVIAGEISDFARGDLFTPPAQQAPQERRVQLARRRRLPEARCL